MSVCVFVCVCVCAMLKGLVSAGLGLMEQQSLVNNERPGPL